MISPLIIPLKDDLFLDLRADNRIQLFEGMPYPAEYESDLLYINSEKNRIKTSKIKGKFISKLLINDFDVYNILKDLRSILSNGSESILRYVLFCHDIPLSETLENVKKLIYETNQIRGRNYGGVILFLIAENITDIIDTVYLVNEEIAEDWEYNHIVPTLLILAASNCKKNKETLHWIKCNNCSELMELIPQYANMDNVMDLTDILHNDSVETIARFLHRLRLSDGYIRTRLYPLALHRLLFEPNLIQECSCMTNSICHYANGMCCKGCFTRNNQMLMSICEDCVVSHLCGKCSYAIQKDTCIFRSLTERFYSLLANKNIQII